MYLLTASLAYVGERLSQADPWICSSIGASSREMIVSSRVASHGTRPSRGNVSSGVFFPSCLCPSSPPLSHSSLLLSLCPSSARPSPSPSPSVQHPVVFSARGSSFG